MKNLVFLSIISIVLFSCSKQTVLPSDHLAASVTVENSETALSQSVVTFKPSTPGSVFISQGLNTLQTDSFSVSGETVYMTKLIFVTSGSVNLSNLKFYINGGQVKSTITYSNDTITVALRKQYVLPVGNYNYILQAKTTGAAGSSFYIALNSAVIVDKNRFMVSIINLPSVADNLILR